MKRSGSTVVKICALLLLLAVMMSIVPAAFAGAETAEKTLKIIFTHDIHSYFVPTKGYVDGTVREHGGAARLKSVIERESDENTVYLDAGDFSMGTLLQAGYKTDAYELRLLGELGCAVTTFGNHEFDFGGTGVAEMLNSAKKLSDNLPQIVQSNMITTGSLTSDQKVLADAMKDYGTEKYTVLNINGTKIAVFGLLGIDGIKCAPTSGMEFEDYIESAKKTVEQIKKNESPDLIVCLSHSGTEGDGSTGEDIELASAVPDINVIISGHTHTVYKEPVTVGKSIIVSSGEYLSYVGALELSVDSAGAKCKNYRLIPVDESVAEDPETKATVELYKKNVCDTYLKKQGVDYDDVICRSEFDFMPLGEMYATHDEYPMGNLIADSYMHEAKRNGIDDIDVALVGLGTIRGSFFKGDITVSDAFEICSLGAGADGTAGHPILSAYITGKELKLLVELDASLGPAVSSIKMSYSGLKYTFNTQRILLDRVTEVYIVRPNGEKVEIEDGKLYKVACNMYAANMLGMLNGLTKGVLKIVPKYQDGTPIEDFYTCSLKTADGDEIKEWIAFMNYLSSFDKKDGVPVIPESYSKKEGRKYKISAGGLAIIKDPGLVTTVVLIIAMVLIAILMLLVLTHKNRKMKRTKAKELKKRKMQKSL